MGKTSRRRQGGRRATVARRRLSVLAALLIVCVAGPLAGQIASAAASAAITLDPVSMAFGDQAVGTTSAPRTVTVANTGDAPLSITSASLAGADAAQFKVAADTCSGKSLAPAATCTVGVAFAPTAAGKRAATLAFADNAPGSPHSVALSGAALGTASADAFVSYNPVIVNDRPTAPNRDPQRAAGPPDGQTVSLGDGGAIVVRFLDNTLTGGGSPAPDLRVVEGGPQAERTSVEVSGDGVTWAAAGKVAGPSGDVDLDAVGLGPTNRLFFVRLTDDPDEGEQGDASEAVGADIDAVTALTSSLPASSALVQPAGLTFADQAVGTTGPAQTVTLTNTGNAALAVASAVVAGDHPNDFAKRADTCTGATIAPGGTCTVAVAFAPVATGARAAALTVTDSAAGSPRRIALAGTGTAAPGQALTLAPPAVDFGSQPVGTVSAVRSVSVTNAGTQPVTVQGVTVQGLHPQEFPLALTSCTNASLAPGASCAVGVVFAPAVAEIRSGTLAVSTSAPGGTRTVLLTGTGTGETTTTTTTTTTPSSTTTTSTSTPDSTTTTSTPNGSTTTTSVPAAGNGSDDPNGSTTTTTTTVPGGSTGDPSGDTTGDPSGDSNGDSSGGATDDSSGDGTGDRTGDGTGDGTGDASGDDFDFTDDSSSGDVTDDSSSGDFTDDGTTSGAASDDDDAVAGDQKAQSGTGGTTTTLPDATADPQADTTEDPDVVDPFASEDPTSSETPVDDPASEPAAEIAGPLFATAPTGETAGQPGGALEIVASAYPPTCDQVYFFFDGARVGAAAPVQGQVERRHLSVPGDARPGPHRVTSSCRPSGKPEMNATEFAVTEASLHRTAFATAVPTPRQVDFSPRALLLSAVVALGLLALIALATQLFDSAMRNHGDEVRRWFGMRPREPSPDGAAPKFGLAVLLVALAGPLWFAVHGRGAFDASTVVGAAGLSLATAVVVVASSFLTLAYLRRNYDEQPALLALPASLAVALAAVLLSRVVGIVPGFFYGFVGGLVFSRRLNDETRGRLAATSAGIVLGLGLVAWLGAGLLTDKAAAPDAGLPVVLGEAVLSGIFWVALTTLAVGLFPVRPFGGTAIVAWDRRMWAVIYGLVLFAFVHLLVRPSNGFVSGDGTLSALVLAGVLGAFTAFAVLIWAHFRVREPRPPAVDLDVRPSREPSRT